MMTASATGVSVSDWRNHSTGFFCSYASRKYPPIAAANATMTISPFPQSVRDHRWPAGEVSSALELNLFSNIASQKPSGFHHQNGNQNDKSNAVSILRSVG